MNNRLTNEWTDTAGEAFGQRGIDGEEGEKVVAKYLVNDGAEVRTYPESHIAQVECKIDLAFRYPSYKKDRWITVDVKSQTSSLQDEIHPDTFRINYKRLVAAQENNTVDRWWHVNLLTGAMAYYDVAEMVGFLNRCLMLVNIEKYYDDLLVPKSVFIDYGFKYCINPSHFRRTR